MPKPIRHEPGGYYAPHIKGKGDLERGKSRRQKKIIRKPPLVKGPPSVNA